MRFPLPPRALSRGAHRFDRLPMPMATPPGVATVGTNITERERHAYACRSSPPVIDPLRGTDALRAQDSRGSDGAALHRPPQGEPLPRSWSSERAAATCGMRGPTTFPTWLGSPPIPPCAADEPPPGLVSTRVPRLTGTDVGVTGLFMITMIRV